MPRVLSVSEIRKHLYWAAGGPRSAGEGEPTVALLGSLFHQLFGQLTGADAKTNLVAPLQLADANLESWQQALRVHVYRTFVSRTISAHQANLQARSSEVLSYWEAVKALCDWLAEVLFQQREHGNIESNRARTFAFSEQEVSAELQDPSWTDTVVVQGRADAIVAQRHSGRHCVVELKLGRTAPEADLLQACLYQLLLSSGSEGGASHLALLAFEPALREHLFEATQIQHAQAKLKALIWRLADGDAAEKTAIDSALLRKPISASSAIDVLELGKKLERAFGEFGAPIDIDGKPTSGPTFIRFLATPRRGVSVRSLTKLGESVWMRLGTSQPPQIALERGRITIDVEQPQRQTVEFATWKAALPKQEKAGISRFAVGVTVDGELQFADFARPESAHFLVAGTNGSGKSEWLRAAIASLLASNQPATLRLALIDPKRSAFSAFEGSAYLWQPLVYSEGAEDLLDGLIQEMERRYAMLNKSGVDNIAEYNANEAAAIPRIVCVCDEYADLLLADKKRRELLETQIARLGSKARAAGIHLMFATQRPSRDIVKGVIDANLSGRIALKVVKAIESNIILGESGAETLLGRGDLLFRDIGKAVRVQGLYVTKDELRELVKK